LENAQQVIFRYSTPEGQITEAANPNGSLAGIAGICNHSRNVLGMMPHPERASEALLGSDEGLIIFESMVNALVHS
jgi:phosphoribosylformylglycinamidine synthase